MKNTAKPSRGRARTPSATSPEPLEAFLDQVRLLFHQAVGLASHLHGDEEVTVAMRAVLEYLANRGPTSVPAIARSRRVSRQHIQVLVNELVEADLVRLEDNPAHKRSKLVALRPRGKRLFERMRKRERVVLERAMSRLGTERVKQGTRILRDVRAALERLRSEDE